MRRFFNVLFSSVSIGCCVLAIIFGWLNDDLIYAKQPGPYKLFIAILLGIAFVVGFARFFVVSSFISDKKEEKSKSKYIKIGKEYVLASNVTVVKVDNSNPEGQQLVVDKEKQDLN